MKLIACYDAQLEPFDAAKKHEASGFKNPFFSEKWQLVKNNHNLAVRVNC